MNVPWRDVALAVIREGCTPGGVTIPPAELLQWIDAVAADRAVAQQKLPSSKAAEANRETAPGG